MREVELSVYILKNLISIEKDAKELSSLESLLEIFEDVLENGHASPYFVNVGYHQLVLSSSSQARAVTIDPAHVKEIEESIESMGEIQEALFVQGGTASGKSDVENGVHRFKAVGNLIKRGVIDHGFDIPVIMIPYRLKSTVSSALHTMQMILNEPPAPKKPNTTSDIKKYMLTEARRQNLDLNKADDYTYLLNKCRIIYRNKTLQSLKSLLTRAKKQQVQDRSDVFHGTVADFKEAYIKAHGFKVGSHVKVKGKKVETYNDELIVFLSTLGGNMVKSHSAALNYKYETTLPVNGVFACQDSGGDSSTVIESRKTFFKELYYCYARNEKLSPGSGAPLMPYDNIFIIPQNIAEFKYDDVVCQAENWMDKECYIKVSRDQILESFSKGIPFEEEWLYKEKEIKLKEVA